MAKSSKNYNFGLKTPPQAKGLFAVTDPENIKPYETKNILISKLIPFKNHPFKLYEGQQFEDMCESIKENGVLLPIIIRSIDDDIYEILSGHNRTEAAKHIGLEYIPAIIRENISDDEALLIVTETNLIQRSFADLSHSERAVALKHHVNAVSKQGKRTDLINEINNILNADKINTNSTSALLEPKLTAREKAAEKYGLSRANVTRYIRLNHLTPQLLNRGDEEKIGLYPAVSISYLLPAEQAELSRILEENNYKIDMKKAETLHEYSATKRLTADTIKQIISGKLNKKPKIKTKPPTAFKIKYKIYAKYFDETMKKADVESIIDKALEEYFMKNK